MTTRQQTTQSLDGALLEALKALSVNTAPQAKLPTWDPQNVTLWFQLAEVQFAAKGITDDNARYNQALAVFPPGVCSSIALFLQAPPTEHKFTGLRDAVTKALRLSCAERYRILHSDLQLEDRKPSQLLQYMYTLEPDLLTKLLVRCFANVS